MKKHIQIKDSYNTWKPSTMVKQMGDTSPLLVIEWWLHNIGYWLTKPFTFLPFIKSINMRCKDVDLMVKVEAVLSWDTKGAKIAYYCADHPCTSVCPGLKFCKEYNSLTAPDAVVDEWHELLIGGDTDAET